MKYNLLHNTVANALLAVRSMSKNENLFDSLIDKQVQKFSKIRKNHPEITRNNAIKIAFLNAAIELKADYKSEKYVLAIVNKPKITPQNDWLKIHRSFVINLKLNGASLRKIERAIFFRFHHKISHTQISKFLNMEECYA